METPAPVRKQFAARRIGWIVLLLLVVFLGDRVGGWVLQKVTFNSEFRYSRLYAGKAGADILLVGNSRGLGFYQPYIEEKTGRSTFNLSYNGLPMDVARVLIADYLERYSAPKVLIIDITLCDKSNEALLAGFSTYMSYSSQLQQLLKEQSPDIFHAGQVSHLLRYNSELFQRAFYHRNRADEDWLLDRTISSYLIQTVEQQPVYDIDIYPYLLENLAEAVQLAQAAGVRVELVISPYYLPYAERMTSLQPLKVAVEKSTGLPVKDYSKTLPQAEYFGDYQHINKNGSKVYIDTMVADGIFEEQE